MEPYKNLSGNSGIAAYELGDESITVKFNDNTVYLYTNDSTDIENIMEMQRLAVSGQGLNTFINQVVKKGYSQKNANILRINYEKKL